MTYPWYGDRLVNLYVKYLFHRSCVRLFFSKSLFEEFFVCLAKPGAYYSMGLVKFDIFFPHCFFNDFYCFLSYFLYRRG